MSSPTAHDRRPEAVHRIDSLESLNCVMHRASVAESSSTDGVFSLSEQVAAGRLVDCLAGTSGSGAGLAALWLCLRASRSVGQIVVIDREQIIYPPAAVAWGIDAKRLLIVSPASARDALTAIELSLRSPAVAAVCASLGQLDRTSFQRLLWAAKQGETFGALVRSAEHQGDPSLADVQLRFDGLVASSNPDDSFLVQATRVRSRHGPAGGQARLSMDWHTGKIEELLINDARHHENSPPQRVAS